MDGLFEEPFSSDDDEIEATGHPLEEKSEVLINLANGFRYHKNGPAQPYDWSKDDLEKMTRLIKDQQTKLVKGRRKIRAIKYNGEEFPGGLLAWVNCVRSGQYFSDNPKIDRGPSFVSGEKTNHWLWNYASTVLLCEFEYWSVVHKQNQNVPSEEVRYPDINQLIFRHTEDFVGGLWSDFHKHWSKYIDEMR